MTYVQQDNQQLQALAQRIRALKLGDHRTETLDFSETDVSDAAKQWALAEDIAEFHRFGQRILARIDDIRKAKPAEW